MNAPPTDGQILMPSAFSICGYRPNYWWSKRQKNFKTPSLKCMARMSSSAVRHSFSSSHDNHSICNRKPQDKAKGPSPGPPLGGGDSSKKRYVSYQRLPYFSPPAFMSRPEGSSRRTCLRGPRPGCWAEEWWGPRRARACPRRPGQSRATCSVRYCPSGYTRPLCGRFSARQAALCFGFIHEPTFLSFCSRTEAAAVIMCCFSFALSIFCLNWSWSGHNPTRLML